MVNSQLTKETVEEWLGPAGSRLKRLPKARQVLLRQWLASQGSDVLTAATNLRGALASGGPINAAALKSTPLSETLVLDDLVRFATRLSMKRPTINAEPFFLSLIESVRTARSRGELKELRRKKGVPDSI